jgi:heterodisulfide reductase subunit A
VTGLDPRIGVFVCHCGINIAGVVDVPSVVEYAKTLPNVVYAENNIYTCSKDSQEQIKKMISEHNLNRVIVASCTPRTHEPLFRGTVREAGLNSYLFEMANIRDQCSWVHMHEHGKATRKAKDLVRMAAAKARDLEPLETRYLPVNQDALVIGGGIAGMTAALELTDQGFNTHLVERQGQLGGNLRLLHHLPGDEDPQEKLKEIENSIKENDKITLYLNAKVEQIDGFVGNYTSKILHEGKETEITHGAVVIATGAEEYKPTEYLYGEDARILTQLDLEEKLIKNEINPNTIVVIQCVGSRSTKEGERGYCSRICCTHAMKSILEIKKRNPRANVYVLYRDIRTYGFKEDLYRDVRDSGAVFIRYYEDEKPKVTREGDDLKVSVFDEIVGKKLVIKPDLLVLSSAVTPQEDNEELAKMLKVPLSRDKFFLEAHMKLRPVDFATEGVFLCGAAHTPKTVDESIFQASAAVARATTLLSKDRMEVDPTISWVVDKNCDGCAYCVDPCPYNAITLLEYMSNGDIKKTVETNEALCKGCGVCMATCPKAGIVVKGFTLDQLGAMVDAALEVS